MAPQGMLREQHAGQILDPLLTPQREANLQGHQASDKSLNSGGSDPALPPWSRFWISLGLSFLICKMGVLYLPLGYCYIWIMGHNNN